MVQLFGIAMKQKENFDQIITDIEESKRWQIVA